MSGAQAADHAHPGKVERRLVHLVAESLPPDADFTEAERAVVARELEAMAELVEGGTLLEQARATALRVPERVTDDSAWLLRRMHEFAGSGNHESCRSSHPTVRALYQLGWEQACLGRDIPWELVVGRGHIAPTFYAEEYVRGRLPFSLLATLHRGGLSGVIHRMWGFPNTMGYSLGVGLAEAISRCFWLKEQEISRKVLCMAGDGELHEGVTFECLRFAEERKLSNLVLLVDANGKGIEPLERELRTTDLAPFFTEIVEVDGTSTEAVSVAVERALSSPESTAIVCRTKKGAHSFKRPDAPAAAPRFSQRCGGVARRFLESKGRSAVTFTADMADRFGLRGNLPYVNVSLAETLSVAMVLGLPAELLKFVATDAKYYLDSVSMLLEAAGAVEHFVVLAGKSWGVWGGAPSALNTLSLQKNVRVYEPITEAELLACLERSLLHPSDVHVVSLIDAAVHARETDCSDAIDESVWLKRPGKGEPVVITFGYAAELVREIVREMPVGHLHCMALRPQLCRNTLLTLKRCAGALVVEYNGVKGGMGEYLRGAYLLDCSIHGITAEIENAPHAVQLKRHGMDEKALFQRLMHFVEGCMLSGEYERSYSEGARSSVQ